jgi:hypothetical protein
MGSSYPATAYFSRADDEEAVAERARAAGAPADGRFRLSRSHDPLDESG